MTRRPKRPPWTGCADTSGDTPCAAPVYALVTLPDRATLRLCEPHAIEHDAHGLLAAARRLG